MDPATKAPNTTDRKMMQDMGSNLLCVALLQRACPEVFRPHRANPCSVTWIADTVLPAFPM
jgi:hypothetical protein